MRLNKNIGFLLLTVGLLLTGMSAFLSIMGGARLILALVAIAASVFLLLDR